MIKQFQLLVRYLGFPLHRLERTFHCAYCGVSVYDKGDGGNHECQAAADFESQNPQYYVCCRPCESCGDKILIPVDTPAEELRNFKHSCGLTIYINPVHEDKAHEGAAA